MQGVGGGFQLVHFARVELVIGGLVPIRAFVVGVVGEADFLDLGLPVVTRGDGEALHQEAVLCEELPKPPRVEVLLELLRLLLPPEKLLRVEAARWV